MDQLREDVNGMTTESSKYNENLNMIETQNQPNSKLLYIEYNDGKVCWYYPIFPEVPEVYHRLPVNNSTPPSHAAANSFYTVFGTEDHQPYYYQNPHQHSSISPPPPPSGGYENLLGGSEEEWRYQSQQMGPELAPSSFYPYPGVVPSNQESLPNPHYYNHNLFYGGNTAPYEIQNSSNNEKM